jgi:hypothetical protein
MKTKWMTAAALAAAAVLTGCTTIPPGAERGPSGTMAFEVQIEASDPGARIEAIGEAIGPTPARLKIFGDPDGTFHDFGSFYYVIKAYPVASNQFVQTRVFMTGHALSAEDRIPQRIYFDMNQPPPPEPVVQQRYIYGPPPVYYGPSEYYGPAFRFHFGPGPGYHHGRHYHHGHRRW